MRIVIDCAGIKPVSGGIANCECASNIKRSNVVPDFGDNNEEHRKHDWHSGEPG